MLLYYLFTCLSCIIFLKSLPLKPLPPWAAEMRLLSLGCWKDLPFIPVCRWIVESMTTSFSYMKMRCYNPASSKSKVEGDLGVAMSLLDLPDLALECILEKLPPAELCDMAGVCTNLREMCTSDHLWERHMKQKWGRIIGPAAYREWQWHVSYLKEFGDLEVTSQPMGFKLIKLLSSLWPFGSSSEMDISSSSHNKKTIAPLESTMSLYLALENGNFWFPAQVYNRENGHVGFMLSCYDAHLTYDSATDTFQARYPPHGRSPVAVEKGVTWERLRAPPVDTSPHDLHRTDCLDELRPGDHIEIQWRRNKGFPYGWWYGVIGHLDSCDGNANYCLCHNSDIVMLEFCQYPADSRWRSTSINRKDHREEGDEERGFYGGIRKLTKHGDIIKWKQLCPNEVLNMP